MELSGFLDVAIALAVLMPAMIGLLAFFIWVAVVTSKEEE